MLIEDSVQRHLAAASARSIANTGFEEPFVSVVKDSVHRHAVTAQARSVANHCAALTKKGVVIGCYAEPVALSAEPISDTECSLPTTSAEQSVTVDSVASSPVSSLSRKRRQRTVLEDISNKKQISIIGSDDATPCMFCEVRYNESNCKWHMCRSCCNWACAKCACMGRKKIFICSSCK